MTPRFAPALGLILALLLAPGARAGSDGSDPFKGVYASNDAAPVFEPAVVQKLINVYREEHGLSPLEIDSRLTAAAQAHSQDLAARDHISHKGSDGSDPWTRVGRTGYPARFSAENVAVGQASMTQLIDGWRRSPAHNANLLAKGAKQMGIAMAYRPGNRFKSYWTLVLASRRDPAKPHKNPRKDKAKKTTASIASSKPSDAKSQKKAP
jgi:hypothetical protein